MPLISKRTLASIPGVYHEKYAAKAALVPLSATFDIFLSHSYSDTKGLNRTDIENVKTLLEQHDLTVYVDWIVDSELDRSNVTPATAALLRRRMDNCRSLLYVTSESSSKSRWMPWELGYSDGKLGRVAILPINEDYVEKEKYFGQEYLGLYPYLTYGIDTQHKKQFWIEESNGKYITLKEWLKGNNPYIH